jgi:hypothetical protein
LSEEQLLAELRARRAAEDRAHQAELLLLQLALRLGLPAARTTPPQTAALLEGWLQDGAP